jgi:hypothetical protein
MLPSTSGSNPLLKPTAMPTFLPQDARTRLLDLLAKNGGCRLPCLWGVTPGKSSDQDAQGVFEPLSGISNSFIFGPDGGGITPVYTEGTLRLFTSVSFVFENNVVSGINLRASAQREVSDKVYGDFWIDTYNSDSFGKRLHPYMLQQVLSDHGIPAAVMISTDGGPNRGENVPGFYIVLIYPDQGLLVSYTTSRRLIDGKVRGCPADAGVELDLYPSGHADNFAYMLAQTRWAFLWPVLPDSPNWKSIDKAASMSPEQFYEVFREPATQCIETPANLWYVPEK